MRSTGLVALLFASAAWAHKPSDSYLTLDWSAAPSLRVDLALRDLDDELALDTDGNGSITWGEVQARLPTIDAAISKGIAVKGCSIGAWKRGITPHSDGAYLVLESALSCAGEGPITVTYSLFFARDPQHHALVRLISAGYDHTLIATPDHRELVFDAKPQASATLGTFLVEGVHHILIGSDHLLFLTALLLPSVLRRRGRAKTLGLTDWEPKGSLKPALLEVFKLVTAFTLAHSLTLALAALDIVDLPSRLVESSIALTVMLAAVQNLWAIGDDERWGPAFALGLVHGFGFSSVLRDSGLRGTSLVAQLFGFNVGVEVGQLLFVLVVVPTCFVLSRFKGYVTFARLGSVVIFFFGLVWLYQRA